VAQHRFALTGEMPERKRSAFRFLTDACGTPQNCTRDWHARCSFHNREKIEQLGNNQPIVAPASKIKEVAMKTLRSVLTAFALLFVATAAHAQHSAVSATIPFNFVVGDHAYPAGDYSFQSDGPVLRVLDEEKMPVGTILSNSCENALPSKDTKLVFQSMGGYYFLQQIWVAGQINGRELSKSKTETQLAKNHVQSESVIVAANITR
jgi:hypothetical protein